MTSNKKIITAGIAVFLLVAVVYAYTNYAKTARVNVTNPDEVNLKEVVCDVSIFNPRGLPYVKNGDLVIESANCQQQYVNSCGRFGLFSDKGSLRLDASGGLGSAADVAVSEGSSQSYSLSWCGSKLTKKFSLKLFNVNNEQIGGKEVTLQ